MGQQMWLGGGFGRRLQIMPLIGGSPRPFLSDRVVSVSWSPDNLRMAFHTRDAGDPIFVADRDGSNPRQIFIGANPGVHNHFPVWSWDGRWLFYVNGSPATTEMDLWRIAPEGGMPERLTSHNSNVGYPTPISANTVLYVARDDSGAGPWLWALDVEQRRWRLVSLGLEEYTSVSASADGSRLVATVADPSSTLWTVPILDRVADERDVQPFRVSSVNAAMPSLPRALSSMCPPEVLVEACGAIVMARPSRSGAPERIRSRRRLDSHVISAALPSHCDATERCVCTCCLPTVLSRSRSPTPWTCVAAAVGRRIRSGS